MTCRLEPFKGYIATITIGMRTSSSLSTSSLWTKYSSRMKKGRSSCWLLEVSIVGTSKMEQRDIRISSVNKNYKDSPMELPMSSTIRTTSSSLPAEEMATSTYKNLSPTRTILMILSTNKNIKSKINFQRQIKNLQIISKTNWLYHAQTKSGQS